MKSRLDRVSLGLALAVPWLFIWQGLDFTDQGYLLTGYRCFFRHPEVTEDSGSLWLTNLVGASWDAAFGRLGVWSMRALWALCLSVGLLLAFRLVRSLCSDRGAALAVLATSMLLADRRETWFSYNTCSSLLFVTAAVCLSWGIAKRRRALLIVAGAAMGAAPFARIPNVLALGLLVTPVFVALVERERRSSLLRDVATIAAGAAGGALACLLAIFLKGDWRLFLDSLRALFAPQMTRLGYSADSLLKQFLKDETHALAAGLPICLLGWGVSRVLGKLPNVVAWSLVVVLGVAGAWGMTWGDEGWAFAVPGTLYWALAAVALGAFRRSMALRTACFIALAVLVIAPLGSNNGIKNAHMGLWLALPLLIGMLHALESTWLAGQGSKLALLAALAVMGEGLNQAASYTYRDAPRLALTTPVQRPQLAAQFTTAARARVVAEVLDALRERVAPDDYLLAYEGTPLLQYLTRTRPYLNRPWPSGNESPDVIASLAADAPKRTGCLPVVVTTTRTTRGADWPTRARKLEEKPQPRGVRRVLKAFLRAHGYRRKWGNGFFEIWEPPSVKPGSCR